MIQDKPRQATLLRIFTNPFFVSFLLTVGMLAAQNPVGTAVACLEGTVYRGTPAIFRASIFPSAEAPDTAPLLVAAAPLEVLIRDQAGTRLSWPLKPISRIAFPLELKPLHIANEYWLLSSEETAALQPGDYTAEVRWNERSSRVLRFQVIDAEDANILSVLRLRAQYLSLNGDAPAAVALLQEAIVRQPNDSGLFYLLAHFQDQARKTEEALVSVNRALSLFKQQFPQAKHPPMDWMRLRSKLDWGVE